MPSKQRADERADKSGSDGGRERQYRITKAQFDRFLENLAAHDAREPSHDPRLHQAMHDAMTSEGEVLRAQIDRYEQLRDGLSGP